MTDDLNQPCPFDGHEFQATYESCRECDHCGSSEYLHSSPLSLLPQDVERVADLRRCYCGGPEDTIYGHWIGSGPRCQPTT